MALGGILFASGGTDIPKVGGQIWLRRFLLPVCFGLLCYFSKEVWWRDIILSIGLCIAFILPYGSSSPYWKKAITACCFSLPTLILGFTFWQVFTPAAFLGMFWMSNSNYWKRLFPWKVVEFLTGTYIAVTIISLLVQRS